MSAKDDAIAAELLRAELRYQFWREERRSENSVHLNVQIAELTERLPLLWENYRVERYQRQYLQRRLRERQVHKRRRPST